MSFTRSHILAITLALSASLGTPAAQSSQTSEGWAQIFADQFVQARASLVKAVHESPGDVRAYEGLVVLDREEERNADLVTHALAIYRIAPESASAVHVWNDFTQAAGELSDYADQISACRSILASKRAPAELRSAASLALADNLALAGQAAAASKLSAGLGFVRNWNVIGPFDNSSQSGFDKMFGPETEIRYGSAYPGKGDVSVGWHHLNLVSADGTALVSTALGNSGEEVFYAATAVESPSAQPAMLTTVNEGSSKIYLNGKLVLSDSTIRPSQPNQIQAFETPVQLHAGWNTVLVKLARDDSQDAQTSIGARFTSLVGTPLILNVDPDHAVTQPVEATPAPASPSTWLTSYDKARPENPVSDLWLCAEYRLCGDNQDDEATALQNLKQVAGSCGVFHEELCKSYSADGSADDAKAQCDMAVAANPRLVDMLNEHLTDVDDQLSPTDKVAQIKAYLQNNPNSMSLLDALVDAYNDAKSDSDSIAAARREAQIDTGSKGLATLCARLFGAGKSVEGRKTMASAVKQYPYDPNLLSYAASVQDDAGNVDDATGLYRRQLALDPTATDAWQALANLYDSAGDLAKAHQVWMTCRANQPEDSIVAESLADVEHQMGHKTAALALYDDALRLRPDRVELRDKIDLVSGDKPALDLAPATPGAPYLAKIPKSSEYPGASAVMLLDEERKVVYPDGGTIERYHDIITVFDKFAVEGFSEIDLREDSSVSNIVVESARIVKADGSVQDVTTYATDEAAEFPSLAPGDTIDLTFRKSGRAAGALAGDFWLHWSFGDTAVASKYSRLVLITPTGTNYQVAIHGSAPQTTTRTSGNWKIVEWTKSAVPAGAIEPLSPPLHDTGSWIDVSSVPDWSTIAKWYVDLSASRCTPDGTVTAKALELTRGAKTDHDKLEAIVNYVKSIPYQSSPFRLSAYVPTEGKKVIRDRFGDCKDKAALLTAMLKAVGISSKMVLLSGRDTGITPYLPSPRFDHAIACVQTADGPLFVDGTAEQMAFGDLPYQDQDVPCLLIDPHTTALTTTPSLAPDRNIATQTIAATLDSSGGLAESYNLKTEGNPAWELRSAFNTVPKDQMDQALRMFASAINHECIYDSGSMDSLKDIEAPFTMGVTLHVAGYASNAGDLMLLKLPWPEHSMDDIRSTISEKNRTLDLEVAAARGVKVGDLSLTVPAGYSPIELPADVSVNSPYGGYTFKYTFANNVLTANYKLTESAFRVPRSELTAYLDFESSFSKQLSRSVVFKKAAGAATQ